ncbi:hypothetical protein BRD02_08570 [Halobacteriales archaeon QS_8_69_73]|nr:MAG: hypothetical protein BRD02_08570 [Halobacteriales archaeon QS_8_69_73]
MIDEQDGLDPAEQPSSARRSASGTPSSRSATPAVTTTPEPTPVTSARGPTVAALADTAVAGGRAHGVARCLRKCRRVTVRLCGRTRVTVARGATDETC